ncbi:phosphoenolpyruvate--glucose-phosphotransferase regulator, partial [Pseudomonas sp. MWU13-2860]
EGWSDVVLYPSPFVARDIWMDGIGLQHESESVLIGQARQDGPVILSLPDARASEQLDGWNVVIHEIAHKLDMLNGIANCSPPLHKGLNQTQWSRVWSQGYRQLCRMLDRGVDPDWLDPYAAENPAEYFAVLSEAFFELPHHLRLDLPEIYEQLKLFYRQDPAGRLPEPAWEPAPEA